MTASTGPISALVVVESMFGNTKEVASAVGRGLARTGVDVEIWDVATSGRALPSGLELLVLGAPTHTFSLSRPETRRDAVQRGASSMQVGCGMREWLTSCVPGPHPPKVAIFDTRVSKVRRLPMAAGPAARRLARARGFDVVERPAYFLVDDVAGPIATGELGRATAWGRRLGDRLVTGRQQEADRG